MTFEKKIKSVIANEELKSYRVYSFLIKKNETGISVEKSGKQIFAVDDKSVYIRYIPDRYCQTKKVLDILLNAYAFECYLSFDRNIGYINKKKERFSFVPNVWKSFKRSDACMRRFPFKPKFNMEAHNLVSKVVSAFESKERLELENYLVNATDSVISLSVRDKDNILQETSNAVLDAFSFEISLPYKHDESAARVFSALTHRFTTYRLEFKKNGLVYAVRKYGKEKKILPDNGIITLDCLKNDLTLCV